MAAQNQSKTIVLRLYPIRLSETAVCFAHPDMIATLFRRLNDTDEVKCHIEAIKQISSEVKSSSLTDVQKHAIINDLVGIYLNCESKHAAKKVLSSCLQAVPAALQAYVQHALKSQLLDGIIKLAITHPITLRKRVDVVGAMLDNFSLGIACLQEVPFEALEFLSASLSHFLLHYGPELSPLAQNELMHDCMAVLQAVNKLIQKCLVSQPSVIIDDSSRETLEQIMKSTVDILTTESFLLDSRSCSGMTLTLIFKLCAKDNIVPLLLASVFPDYSVGQATIGHSHWLVDCFQRSYCSQSVSSRLCLIHGIVALLDLQDLSLEYTEGHCLLVTIFFEEIIPFVKRCSEANLKLLVPRCLTLWTIRACSVVESVLQSAPQRLALFLGDNQIGSTLFQYVWMTWEEPVDAMRLNARTVFEHALKMHVAASDLEAQTDPFIHQLSMSLLSISWLAKGKYGPLCCLVNTIGANQMMALHPGIATDILNALKEHALASFASELYEQLCISHRQEFVSGMDVPEWDEKWLTPIVEVLKTSTTLHRTHITEYILPKLLRIDKGCISFLTKQLAKDAISEQSCLSATIMCVRRARALGLQGEIGLEPCSRSSSRLWHGFVHIDILKQALCSLDEQMRLDAFALVCENVKMTEPLTDEDFHLIKLFIPLNLNNQRTSFRHSMMAHLKKLFMRIQESEYTMRRTLMKSKCNNDPIRDALNLYEGFIEWLVKILFSSLYPGSAFARRCTALTVLSLFITIFGDGNKGEIKGGIHLSSHIKACHVQTLVECLSDTYEEAKMKAFMILTSLPKHVLALENNLSWVEGLLEAALTLSQSTKPHDCTTAAYILRLLLQQNNIIQALRKHPPLNSISVNYQSNNGSNCVAVNQSEPCDDVPVCGSGAVNGLPGSHDDGSHDDVMARLGSFMYLLESSSQNDVFSRSLLTLEVLIQTLHDQTEHAEKSLIGAAASGPMYGTLHCIRYLLKDLNMTCLSHPAAWRRTIINLIDVCFIMARVVSPVVHNSSPEGNLPEELREELVTLRHDSEAGHSGMVHGLPGGGADAIPAVLMPQYLMVCCWRSIKEVSLTLGHLASHAPVINSQEQTLTVEEHGLITFEQVMSVGEYFITQLLESKHRGAFELAYTGFDMLCEMLWRSPISRLREVPVHWLDQMLCDIQSEERSARLCATRRSAGVPFYVQAVVSTEPGTTGKVSLTRAMTTLIKLALTDEKLESILETAKVHALNILRALFRDTQLGEDIAPFVADGVMASILGFKSDVWSIRNCSTQLFGALMTRIFGVKRCRDENNMSRKNCLTGRVFFHRYPALFQFIHDQLNEATVFSSLGQLHIHPSLYPVLMLLARLFPSTMEGSDSTLHLAPYIPFIIRCASSPVLKTRLMAGRALRPLVVADKLTSVLSDLLDRLPISSFTKMTQNGVHGVMVQIEQLLLSLTENNLESLLADVPEIMQKFHQLTWLMTRDNPCLMTRKVYLETVSTVLALPITWKPVTTDVLKCLSHEFLQTLEHEVADKWQVYNPHTPGLIDFTVSVTNELLNNLGLLITESTSSAGDATENMFRPKLEDIITSLLTTASGYEVTLVTLQFLQSLHGRNEAEMTDIEDEAGRGADLSCPYMYRSNQKFDQNLSIMYFPVVECIKTSQKIFEGLIELMFNGSLHSDCLSQTLQVLSVHSLTNVFPWRYGKKTVSISDALEYTLNLIAHTTQDDIRCAALSLIAFLLPEIGDKSQLKCLIQLLEVCSGDNQPPVVQLTAAHLIHRNAIQLLIDPTGLIGVARLRVWTIVIDLLQDDDLELKCTIAGVLPHVDPRHTVAVHTVQTLTVLIGQFIKINFAEYPVETLEQLIHWITRNSADEPRTEEHVFDKGEMNAYQEDIIFAQIVSRYLRYLMQIVQHDGNRMIDDNTNTNISELNVKTEYEVFDESIDESPDDGPSIQDDCVQTDDNFKRILESFDDKDLFYKSGVSAILEQDSVTDDTSVVNGKGFHKNDSEKQTLNQNSECDKCHASYLQNGVYLHASEVSFMDDSLVKSYKNLWACLDVTKKQELKLFIAKVLNNTLMSAANYCEELPPLDCTYPFIAGGDYQNLVNETARKLLLLNSLLCSGLTESFASIDVLPDISDLIASYEWKFMMGTSCDNLVSETVSALRGWIK